MADLTFANAPEGLSAPSTIGPMSDSTRVPETALAAALDRVGDRWSLLLVEELLPGQRRFNDLAASVPGIAPNILTDRLRRLEREGIVVATPYSTHPPRREYALTADGRELAGALRLLADWGARRSWNSADFHDALRHVTCGTPLEARWYCTTCAIAVTDREAGETRAV